MNNNVCLFVRVFVSLFVFLAVFFGLVWSLISVGSLLLISNFGLVSFNQKMFQVFLLPSLAIVVIVIIIIMIAIAIANVRFGNLENSFYVKNVIKNMKN